MDIKPGKLLFTARTSGVTVDLKEGSLNVTLREPHVGGANIGLVRNHASELLAFLVRRKESETAATNVVARFEASVDAWPKRTALIHGDVALTYEELDRAVNRLANRLIAAGVRAETRVGVMCTRESRWIIAMLAIMKAGGVYIAVGTRLPAEVIADYCVTGKLHMLIGTGATMSSLSEFDLGTVKVLELQSGDTESPQYAATRPTVAIHPQQLAYVILTSGTTGRPKFVAIPHDAVNHFVGWYASEFQLHGDQVRGTQLAMETFDAHILETLPFLCAGATLVLVDDTTRLDMRALSAFLVNHHVTHCFLSTPLAEAFLSAANHTALPVLRYLMVGGDVLRRHPQQVHNIEIVNLYGPAESTVLGTYAYLSHGLTHELPPIGYAVGAMRTRAVNDALEAVTQGAEGELSLSGPNLARGYLGDPRETAQRFVPDARTETPGGREYLTGDLVHYRPDGQLQYHTRKDKQLKVRGMRVEPGAIEAAMLSHPGITEAAVIAHPDLPDALVGYCQFKSDEFAATTAGIDDWKLLYDDIYTEPYRDIRDEFRGWSSSFDGRPLPIEEMEEWASETARRVLSLAGKRMLEVGCGTGIILTRVFQGLESYDGIDISPNALRFIQDRLGGLPNAESMRIRLFSLPAHQLASVPDGSYDSIVMNSVCQYFPDATYLASVLDTMLGRLEASGAIFVGDIRHFGTLDAFALRVQQTRGPAIEVAPRFAERARAEADAEEELLVAPEFFQKWAQRHSRVAEVLIAPKESQFENEMAHYRYDVIIRTRPDLDDSADAVASIAIDLNWSAMDFATNDFEQCLRAMDGNSIQIRGIPHAGVYESVTFAERVFALPSNSFQYLEEISAETPGKSIRPADALRACALAGYNGRIFLNGERPGYFGIQATKGQRRWPRLPSCTSVDMTANNPSINRQRRAELSALREHLKRTLPDYLVPARLIALPKMPMTANGKVDRATLAERRLPKEKAGATDMPVTQSEQLIARWLAQELNLAMIGRTDNLFDLGGHSLLAMRLASYIGEITGIDFPIHLILREPTVSQIARELETMLGGAETAAMVFEILDNNSKSGTCKGAH